MATKGKKHSGTPRSGVKQKSRYTDAQKKGKSQVSEPSVSAYVDAKRDLLSQPPKNRSTATSLEGKFENMGGLADIVQKALKGVGVKTFYSFAYAADISDKHLAEILHISPRTLSNYRAQNKRLEPVKGEHLLKLISLYKKGEEVFGILHEFASWLSKPGTGSKNTMQSLLFTPGGVDLVSQELDRIAYGYAY